MKLHLLSYIALLSIGITPQAVAKPGFFEQTNQPLVLSSEIPRISNIERPLTSVEGLAQKPTPTAADESEVVQVKGVRLNPTSTGLEVILETLAGEQLQANTQISGNTLIADIPNTQLALPKGREFRAENPSESITLVTVTQLAANSIRVSVTGIAAAPTAQLVPRASGLVLSLTPAAEEEEEIEIVVTGEQETDYRVPDATTATKLPVPLRDVPQSIQVIPRQVIEDRQVVRLNELTDNVSGVQRVPGYGGLSSLGVRVRGFDLQFETLRNGFRDFGYLSPRDVANVERVEVLKGPASVLYGGGVVGFSGQINTVTEKPLDEPYYEVNATVGSYDFYRPTLDVSGPLVSDGSLLYRLNVAYENADSFRDFNENESIFFAPALTWNIGPQTNLTAEFEYQKYDYFFDNGFPPEPEFLRIPIDRFLLGEPDLNDANFESNSITYDFEHQFSERWRFRQGFNALIVSGDTQQAFFEDLEKDRRTLPRFASRSNEEQENYTLQNEIFGNFETGSLRHNFLFGVELARYRFDFKFEDAELDSIDILDPQYGARPGEFELVTDTRYGSDNLGIYLQDLIEVLPNLKILAGVRFDLNDSIFRDRVGETSNEQTETDFSPRVGIVYQPIESTSLYFNWSRSFTPQFGQSGTSQTGEVFDPTTGEQFEVGIKQDFVNNQLSATLAFYQITRQNVLIQDPADETGVFSIQTGEQRSRGIELDIVGELLPGWNIIATYAYTDAVVTEDEIVPVGDRLYGVPKNSASLWTTYEIQSGALQGLGVWSGVVFVGEREAILPNDDGIELDSYMRTDAALFYRRNNWRVALNIDNLFDIKYYENIENFTIFPGEPLTLRGTVSVQL